MKPEYAQTTRIQFFKSADYYGMSEVYEDLYHKSTNNINVKNLIPIIKDKRNMLIAIRCIKANKVLILLVSMELLSPKCLNLIQ